MKIVFLSPASQGGGAEEVLYDLVSGLRAAKEDWVLHVIGGETGPLMERLRRAGAETELLPFPAAFRGQGEQSSSAGPGENHLVRALRTLGVAARFVRYCVRLRRRLKELRPDVIHSNGMKMHLAAAMAGGGVPVVWHLHDYLSLRRTTSRVLPRLRSRVRLALANSQSVAEDAGALLHRLRIEVLENSVDLERFRPEGPRTDLDRLCDWDPAPPAMLRVGLVATFARWKGQDLFIDAVGRLPASLPARFYLIGGPVYATAHSQWTREELVRLTGRVALPIGLTGWVADPAAALRALDIVVHASIQPEPFGLVIVQALACGKPVIVSGEGGAAEVVRGNPAAVTFTPREAQSLADALLFWVKYPEKRAEAAVTGPFGVRTRFSKSEMSLKAANYFRSIAPQAG